MKSIIQEASTLSKAIQKGWIKAGKPTLFSIKIMQEPSKNFIGMTMQTAKIVVFCGRLDDIDTTSQQQSPQTHRQKQPQAQPQAPKAPKEVQHRPLKQQDQPRPPQKNYQRYPQRPQQHPVKQPAAQINKPPIPENKPKQ